jgi:hypothetical protein
MRTPRFYALRKRSGWYQLFPNTTIVLFFLTMGVMLWTLDAREAEQQKQSGPGCLVGRTNPATEAGRQSGPADRPGPQHGQR